MDWGELLNSLLPILISFLLGLIAKSPVYQTTKKLADAFVKAVEDDKITKEELERLEAIIKEYKKVGEK